ncbi:hypothetical protein KFE25_011315 [Diacronema lutheri]|uniref:FAD dependent oxidoreductase domain-containing protein n=1 Tax=Diacronema lutheri TaxID=2081491 RepID=A0A8J5X6I2_DIALT|nr:hypothetical protein KFE25_011315 [Diacronema lutheri]
MPSVVIVGGGIVGTSTAFYLAKRGCAPTIVERCHIAAEASGKAGGFLARDWQPSAPADGLAALSAASFDLHAELAHELGAEHIDYRRLSCIGVETARAGGARQLLVPRKLEHVQWTEVDGRGVRQMGDQSTIGQVHPRKLTTKMAEVAVALGATIVHGIATAIHAGAPVRVALASGEELRADAVVLAMGPWTDQIDGGLVVPRMLGQKYHSLTMQIDKTLDQAVFFQGKGDIELYPRPRGEVYVTGYTGDEPAPVAEAPGHVEVRESKLHPHELLARTLCAELAHATRTGVQACYLPLTQDGVPAIGKLPSAPGVYVGTGHSCWGILNGPATGKALAELILDGKQSVVPSLNAFDPARFARATARRAPRPL